MQRSEGEPRVVRGGPVASREELRTFIQERLSLFGSIMFWFFWVLVVLVAGLYRLWPALRPARVDIVLTFATAVLVVSAIIWFVALRRPRASIAVLHAIDILFAVFAGATLGASAYFQSELHAAPYAALLSQLTVVFTRAIIVPSTGRRTAAVTALSFAPLLAFGLAIAIETPARIDLPPAAYAVAAVFYAVVATVVAATGSRVIYGLRRQVREAMQLGQYTLGEKIGEGGMGAVYRARHALLRRPTAIKLIPPEKVRPGSLRRFEREVQNMSLLTHPNTVAIYDYGHSPDGVFYYAMELLDGIDLDTLVKRYGRQPAPRVTHILRQICGALDEAHASGLTHRDIKPANVILCQRGHQPDVVKVVDFGLVKEIRETGEEDTSARVIVGTPAYISPEAVTDPARVGPRSDLYSLGALAYYLLTARHVFAGKTAVEVCLHHVSTPPVPPAERTDNPIPAGLQRLVMACLAKDPAARPESARELQRALERIEPVGDWDEAAARAWWRELSTRRDASEHEPTASGRAPHTVTIDVSGRTALDDSLPTSHRAAG